MNACEFSVSSVMTLRSRLCIFIYVQMFVTKIHYRSYYKNTISVFFLSLHTLLKLNKCIYTNARQRKWRVKLKLVKDNQIRNSICHPHTFSFSLFLSSLCDFCTMTQYFLLWYFLTEEKTFFYA